MNRSRDGRETTILTAAVAAVPLLIAAGIGVVPQLHSLWLQMIVIAVMLVAGLVIAVRIFRSARNLLQGQPGDEEIVSYTDDRETGILLKGTIENVSLRVSSVHRIVDALTRAIPEEERQSALYDCGHEVGESWVADYRHELPKLEIAMADITRQVLKWSEYDATAGMGRLTIAVDPETCDGLVVLSNGFLSRSPASFPLNWWFAGYLAGTLGELLGCSVRVEVVDPTTVASPTALFRVVPKSHQLDHRVASTIKPTDPRSVARGKVWLKRLKTPLPDEVP
jgi:predicted hydrocarbon binding protein